MDRCSLKDLLALPDEVKREAGRIPLHRVQNGLDPEDLKPFQTVGLGVKEIRINGDGGAFKILYVVKRAENIYVVYSFQKKTQKTSPKDVNIAKTRMVMNTR